MLENWKVTDKICIIHMSAPVHYCVAKVQLPIFIVSAARTTENEVPKLPKGMTPNLNALFFLIVFFC